MPPAYDYNLLCAKSKMFIRSRSRSNRIYNSSEADLANWLRDGVVFPWYLPSLLINSLIAHLEWR